MSSEQRVILVNRLFKSDDPLDARHRRTVLGTLPELLSEE